ncbi:hypothetical protein B0O80DRAFT_97793 [Mortierella sp. GBAus27b]|nr:hypothetical protein B0O80DRAFT_97793 [Mortierella sp. GBAus27b]
MDVNDDDDDESNGSGVGVSRAASNRSRRSRLSVLIHGQGPRDNDTRQAEEGRHTRGEKNPNSRSLRFFPRIDLPRFPGTLRSGHSDAPALGRRSGSFNDGVFGKRESGQSGNPAGGRDSLNRDDRCHTWTEHKHEMSGDNGGESLDVRGFDQESRSRAGSTGRQSEKAQAMDGTELPAMPPLVVIREDGSGATSTAGSLHSRPSLRQQGTSQVSFPSDPSGADDGSAPSAGPSTAGFVTPEDWDGEHRRSSISTVAVPDNGRGLPRANSTGSQKKVQRKSSLYITTPAPQSNEGEGPGESTEEEAHQHDGGKSSEEDDGRGVGRIDASAFSNKHRRISQMDLEDDDDDLAESSKDATPDLPYFYSDGGGVLDAIGIHPEDYAPSNSRSNSIRSKRSTKGGAISRSSTRSSITGSQRPRQHDKELTSTTAHTAVASTSGEVTTTNAKKVKNKASGPKQRTRKYDPCAICLEEYEVGDHIRELPCKHFFHSQCIDPWFRDVHGICPVCKRDYSQAGGTDAPGGQAQEGEPRVSTFLSPLALFAGAGAGHYWLG